MLFDLEKLIEYWASAVNVVSSNSYVGPLPSSKISFFLLSICTDELMSIPKITSFLPMLLSGNETNERESNLMLWPLYLYLPGSSFLVSFTDSK